MVKNMAKVNSSGLMELVTRENGKTIKCMARVFSHGLMAVVMKENMKVIENMDLVYLHGQMVVDTRECGEKANKLKLMRNLLRIYQLFHKNPSDQCNLLNSKFSLNITQYNSNRIASLANSETQISK